MPSSKTDILDEVAADQDPRTQCRVCAWVATQPPEDQEQWRAVTRRVSEREWTKRSLARALRKHGAKVSSNSVDNHVNGNHQK